MANRKILYTSIWVLIFSVSCKQKGLSDEDLNILKTTIEHAFHVDCCRIPEMKACYLVDPHINDINPEEWKQIGQFLSKHGFKKPPYPHPFYFNRISEYSTCSHSEIILQIIYFNKKFVVLKITDNLDTYTVDELRQKKKKTPSEVYYIYFERNGNKWKQIDMETEIYD